eukprot:11244358-Ditylum_brightwellii.AAC.1
MLISNQVSVTYDLKQEVDNEVEENRPEIVVLDEKEHRALITDVTVPLGINMTQATARALGTRCHNLDGLLAQMLPCANLDQIQKRGFTQIGSYSAPYLNRFS